jgi:hypothetical protein
VANGHGAGQLASTSSVKISADQAHALDVGQMLAVRRGNAGRLLPAMLQCVEPKINLTRGMRMPVDGNDTALFVQFVGAGKDLVEPRSCAKRGPGAPRF